MSNKDNLGIYEPKLDFLTKINAVIIIWEVEEHKGSNSIHKRLIDLDEWVDCTNEEYEEILHRELGHTQFTLTHVYRPGDDI